MATKPAYFSYFDNFFLNLVISRPNYKALAEFTLAAVRKAALGSAFDGYLTALETAIKNFDENLADRNDPTQGTTEAYRTARKAWLTFVDDTMKDYVTPRLRRLPVYADFKALSKRKLAALNQQALPTAAEALVKLYETHAAALNYPAVGADARTRLDDLKAAATARADDQALRNTTIVELAQDWVAIARALRRVKAQLELTFDEPEQVYAFFDFSKVKVYGGKKGVSGKSE